MMQRNFIDNPDPANDFVDAFVPQVLPPYTNPFFLPPYTNPPFLPPPRNDSAINPQPFIEFNSEKKDFNIPIILTLGIIGFLILK